MNRLSGFRLLMAAAVLGAGLASAPAQGAPIYVKIAPPAPIVEVRTAAPSAKHVWVPGFHRWNGTSYMWIAGHYELAPRHGQRWVPGHWAHHRVHGHYFVEGHWR